MDASQPLNSPWLVAVWPGMGGVALNAGYYLMAKLHMNLLAEYDASDLFDIDHVEVKSGVIQTGGKPRNRFFVRRDPRGVHDLVVFIGEAQPPRGKYAFCEKLARYAQQLGVERVFTFAAMATQMHPEHEPRVFGAATNQEMLPELLQLELEILEDGNIGGLNGVLLGAAADVGLRGTCLLGEMPHLFAQLPFPKASQAILEVFGNMARLDLDLTELAEQSRLVQQQLGELLSRVEQSYGGQAAGTEEEEPTYSLEPPEEEALAPEHRRRIEDLFGEAETNRSKAFELKQELDRHGVFKEFEDRFLDLFKNRDS